MVEHDARLALLQGWLSRELGLRAQRVEPASSDASFRRYFRAVCDQRTFIVMDAPPERENVRPYLEVAGLLESLGIHVPRVYEADIERGLVLLEDLGSASYLARLAAAEDAPRLYRDALEALSRIQLEGAEAAAGLAPYDEGALRREMALMPEWFLERHLRLEMRSSEREMLEQAFQWLIGRLLEQPQVFVHRDYHSRNLMVVDERNPGVIDFQDAVRGPIGYDLVSLLRDCYIAWPRERVSEWVSGYRELLRARGGPVGEDREQFQRWFDLAGVQRHLKVLGIFARLWYRDGKPGYLRDLPLTLEYLRAACRDCRELEPISEFLERRVAGELAPANQRARAQADASGAQ